MPQQRPDVRAAGARQAGKPSAAPDGPTARDPAIDRLNGEVNALRRRAKRQLTAMANTLAELDRLLHDIEQHQRSLER